MADVFVSYAREDRAIAVRVVQMLEEQGWEVWWDREINPGSAFSRVIEQEIEAASCVVVLWTKDSVASDWVQAEASEGLANGKLIPIRCDGVEVPLVFRLVQASDFSAWPRVPQEELDQFIGAVGLAVSKPVTVPVRSQSKSPSRRLLIGILALLIAAVTLTWFNLSTVTEDPVAVEPNVTDGRNPVHLSVGALRGTPAGLPDELVATLQRIPTVHVFPVGEDLGDFQIRGVKSGDSLMVSLFDTADRQTRSSLELDLRSVSSIDLVPEITRWVAREFGADLLREQPRVSEDAYLQLLALRGQLTNYLTPAEREVLIVELEALIEANPRFSEAIATLCRLQLANYSETGQDELFTAAERMCLRASRLDPSNPLVMVSLGDLYLNAGQLDDAQLHYASALEASPYLTVAMVGAARLALRRDDVSQARRWVERAVVLEPQNHAAYRVLARGLFVRGAYAEAASFYEKAAESADGSAMVQVDLGAAYFMLEQFDRAVANWESSVQRQPSAAGWSNLGSAYFFEGRFDDALGAYQNAIASSGEDYRVWLNAGDAALHAGKTDADTFFRRSAELARGFVEVNPDDNEVLSALAVAYASLGEEDMARRYVQRALEGGQDNIYVLYDVAVAFSRLSAYDEMSQWLDALRAGGYSPTLINKDANFRKGNRDSA